MINNKNNNNTKNKTKTQQQHNFKELTLMGRNPRPTRKFAVQLTTTAIDVAVGRPAKVIMIIMIMIMMVMIVMMVLMITTAIDVAVGRPATFMMTNVAIHDYKERITM